MVKGWIRWVVVALTLITLVALAGCGGGKDKVVDKSGTQEMKDLQTKSSEAMTKGTVKQAEAPAASKAGEPKKAEPKKGGTLIFGAAKVQSNLNPFSSTTSINQYVRELSYENLLVTDQAEGDIYPNLAKSWKVSDDGKVYTFALQQGVKFHNGKEMTAEDVVFTTEFVKNPENAANGQTVMNQVVKVEAVDKYTVRMTLKDPSPAFLNNLAAIRSMAIIPAGSMENGVKKISVPPPGTGPFKYSSWTAEQETVVERFDDYWKGAPYLDKIIHRVIGDEDVRFSALRAGDIDIAERVAVPQVLRVKKGEITDINLHPAAVSGYRRLGFNTQKAPMNNAKFRQAIAWGFDKQQFLDEVLWGMGTVANIKMPPGSKWDLDWPKRGPDLAKAKELLQQSGYKGEPIGLLGRKGHEDMAENIVRQFTQMGINMKVEITESGVYDERQINGEFDITIRGGSVDSDPSPSLRPEYYTFQGERRSSNIAGWKDKKTDELFEKMDTTVDPDKRFEAYKELALYLYDQTPYLDVSYDTRFFASRPWVKDFTPTAGGSYSHKDGGLWRTWLDKK